MLPPSGYLDATAGQPLEPKAREILLAGFDQAWANPEGMTPPSRQARALADAAREQIAGLLGTQRDRIWLVPDAYAAVLGSLTGRLVHSAVERSEVLTYALNSDSASIKVDSVGRIDLNQLASIAASGDALFVQAANGEVGTLQPLAEVIEIADSQGSRVFSDFNHAIGVVDLPSGITAYANASTWGGPRGIGIVISDQPYHADNLSIPLALAAAAALEGWLESKDENERLYELTAMLREQFSKIEDVDVLGDPHQRLPHIMTTSFLYVDGQRLMDELAKVGLFVGSGSACTSSRLEPSHVLAAMGALTHGNLRVVLPRRVAVADVEKLVEVLPGIVERVRNDLR